ncbi:MAG: YqjF family protein [Akkermansiaceae bacterium]
MKFIQTIWTDLIMANYEVDAKFLDKYVPVGCELDLYDGRALVSVVAFGFSKTRLCGVPMPFYRNFPEINLRIYVKRKVADEWRRGVVFIKEIIPHRLPAWIARTVFKENIHVMPVKFMRDGMCVHYRWGKGNILGGMIHSRLKDWEAGTEEAFIGDNFWAYKRVSEVKTLEFKVTHRAWKMGDMDDLVVNFDFAELYGADVAAAIKKCGAEPRSVFYVDGSAVEVTRPKPIGTI